MDKHFWGQMKPKALGEKIRFTKTKTFQKTIKIVFQHFLETFFDW